MSAQAASLIANAMKGANKLEKRWRDSGSDTACPALAPRPVSHGVFPLGHRRIISNRQLPLL